MKNLFHQSSLTVSHNEILKTKKKAKEKKTESQMEREMKNTKSYNKIKARKNKRKLNVSHKNILSNLNAFLSVQLYNHILLAQIRNE